MLKKAFLVCASVFLVASSASGAVVTYVRETPGVL